MYSHSDSSFHLPPQLPFPFPNPTKPNKCALFISSLGFRLLVLLLLFYDCLLFCCTRAMFMPYPNIVEPSYAYLFLHGYEHSHSLNTFYVLRDINCRIIFGPAWGTLTTIKSHMHGGGLKALIGRCTLSQKLLLKVFALLKARLVLGREL